MRKWAKTFLGGLMLFPESGMAQSDPSKANPKEEALYIQTDNPPSPEAEKVMPTHPFFAAPSTGNEAMEQIEDLNEKVKKLEERVRLLEEGKK